RVVGITDDLEKVLRLLDAVAAGCEVISTPKQSRRGGFRFVGLIHRIETGLALRGFMNNADDSGGLGLLEIDGSVVMRKIDDCVKRIWHWRFSFIEDSDMVDDVAIKVNISW